MMVTKTELSTELVSSLRRINYQIDVLERCAKEMNISVYDLRDTSGGWTLIPLLSAKAQLLHSITLMTTKGK